MPKALSLDLRTRIADAVAAGERVRVVGARFHVSPATAVRLGQKRRAGADLTPARRGGARRVRITPALADWLQARMAEKPDLTLRALAAELTGRGTPVSHDAVWRCLRGRGLTHKKRP